MLSNKEKQNLKIKYYRTKYSDIQKAKRIKDLILKRIPFDIIIQDPELIPTCWFWKTPESLRITYNIPLEPEKENTTSADISIDPNIEIEKYKAINSQIVLITNDNNSQSYLDNAEDGFTVVTQRKRKDKKEYTNQKTELVRSALYRKACNGV